MVKGARGVVAICAANAFAVNVWGLEELSFVGTCLAASLIVGNLLNTNNENNDRPKECQSHWCDLQRPGGRWSPPHIVGWMDYRIALHASWNFSVQEYVLNEIWFLKRQSTITQGCAALRPIDSVQVLRRGRGVGFRFKCRNKRNGPSRFASDCHRSSIR